MTVNTVTGQVLPARCKANKCPYCGPFNARLIAGAIGLAAPERAILLTNVGNDWQATRTKMRAFTFRLRHDHGLEVNQCWHVEPNPKGTGHHAHLWQRGSYLPQRLLSAAAGSVGMGKVAYINRMKGTKGQPVGYGMKLAGVPYGLKLAEAEETLGTYLEANGGRLVHATRGFWRDDDGKACGQREAMSAWASRNRIASDEDGKWVTMPDEQRLGFVRARARELAAEYLARF